MKAISLMYHDVVAGEDWDSSGFPGADAANYKMSLQDFDNHMETIAKSTQGASTVDQTSTGTPLYITFDDGGVSAVQPIIDSLETQGWRGHFFITTGRIGTSGFVSEDDVRELHSRGHIVGSHSCTHPTRMAACTRSQLESEWNDSITALSELLGSQVNVASVPGGYYSKDVAQAAEEAGITRLFTSEPTSRCHRVGRCQVFGRYTIKRDTAAAVAANLAQDDRLETAKQATLWKAKKIAKLGGPLYLRLRARLLK